MRKILITSIFILISLIGYNQEKHINFIDIGNNSYVVKLSFKYDSEEQKESFKKSLSSNEFISAVSFSSYDGNQVKITCSTPKIEPFLFETLDALKIRIYNNVTK